MEAALQSLRPKTNIIARAGFLHALEELSNLLALSSIEFQPATPLSLARLGDLDDESLSQIEGEVRTWVRSLESATPSASRGLTNLHNQGLKSFLQLMKLRIPADFFDSIGSGDVVEIYLFDSKTGALKQAWRNWLFMSMCSYDLVTLMTKPMEELFDRQAGVQAIIAERVQAIFQNPVTQACEIPSHVMTEKLDAKNRQFLITNRFCAPVFDAQNGNVIGFVATLEAKPLGSAYAHLPNVETLTPAPRPLEI